MKKIGRRRLLMNFVKSEMTWTFNIPSTLHLKARNEFENVFIYHTVYITKAEETLLIPTV